VPGSLPLDPPPPITDNAGIMAVKAHLSKWTVVLGTHVRRLDSLEEAEKARDEAVLRGTLAWIIPPLGVRM
jgi:hypothetical protein